MEEFFGRYSQNQQILSYVRRCWLAMPLGAGILCWVLACNTIEENKRKQCGFRCLENNWGALEKR